MPYKKYIVDGKWTGRYNFYFRFLGRQFRKRVSVSPSMVDRAYRKWENEEKETFLSPKSNVMLFDILDEFLLYAKKAKKPSRYRTYCFMVDLFKEFFTDMKVSDFKSYMVDDYRYWRRTRPLTRQTGEVADSTINRDIAVLSHFFNFCKEREYFRGDNPVKKKKVPEEPRSVRLKPAQVRELLHEASGHLHTCILLALNTGMRRGEILCLKWNHIDFDNSIIVLPAGVTKTKKSRVVYLPEYIHPQLLKLRLNSESDYVITHNGKPIKKLRKSWENLRDRLSFKTLPDGGLFHFHDLRHVYAQALREIGVQDSDIAAACGHADSSVTMQFYANMPSEHLNRKVNDLQNVFGNLAS
jgi:integrase